MKSLWGVFFGLSCPRSIKAYLTNPSKKFKAKFVSITRDICQRDWESNYLGSNQNFLSEFHPDEQPQNIWSWFRSLYCTLQWIMGNISYIFVLVSGTGFGLHESINKTLSCLRHLWFVPSFVYRYPGQLKRQQDFSRGHIRLP